MAPALGTFVLHSSAVPDLPAGSYTVHTEQQIDAPGATTATFDSHVEVTAPRFLLPRDQILSTFPPNKSQGSFASRLPQIVLKRRTLPWERELDGKLAAGALPSGIPWLALVTLAEGEYEFRGSRPIAECVTSGVVLEGRNDTPVGDAIVVTGAVIAQVFPTKDELPLLAHVREVDLSDTELAMGDDDGWLAVVLSNRLPQEGVDYRACLVSLEGQYDLLLDTAEVEPDPAVAFESPYVQGQALIEPRDRNIAAASRSTVVVDAWSSGNRMSTGRRTRGRGDWLPPLAGDTGQSSHTDAPQANPAPRFTFPVLASWQFTCTDGADFQQLMQRLDVGLLDTVLRPPAGAVGRKPAPPRTQPEPVVTATGHIRLSHVNRAGEPDTVWYRGPLVPHPGCREMPGPFGVLPLLHSSDQARRIGPDGRENLSLAAAFEIGRLLALAEPSVVAAFLNWRKEGFEQARRTALLGTDDQLSREEIRDIAAGFAARLGNRILAELGADGAVRFGDLRPPKDGGCPIAGLDDVDIVQLIATGFGLPVDIVREFIDPGAERGGGLDVPVGDRPSDLGDITTRIDVELGHLTDLRFDTTTVLAEGALAGSGTPGGAPDALDDLINRGR
jgi:hypothetical protein